MQMSFNLKMSGNYHETHQTPIETNDVPLSFETFNVSNQLVFPNIYVSNRPLLWQFMVSKVNTLTPQ